MFKHLRRVAAAAAFTLAVGLAVAPAPHQHQHHTPAPQIAMLADLARGALLTNDPRVNRTFRATILELDSRGTFGVAGSLA